MGGRAADRGVNGQENHFGCSEGPRSYNHAHNISPLAVQGSAQDQKHARPDTTRVRCADNGERCTRRSTPGKAVQHATFGSSLAGGNSVALSAHEYAMHARVCSSLWRLHLLPSPCLCADVTVLISMTYAFHDVCFLSLPGHHRITSWGSLSRETITAACSRPHPLRPHLRGADGSAEVFPLDFRVEAVSRRTHPPLRRPGNEVPSRSAAHSQTAELSIAGRGWWPCCQQPAHTRGSQGP